MTKSRGINRPKFQWREEVEVLMLRQHYATVPSGVLAQVFGCTVSAVYQKAKALGLKKSAECIARVAREKALDPNHPMRATRFEKGLIPANKGLRRPGWAPGDMAKTQFKKGQLSGQAARHVMPIGSYRVVKEGGKPSYVEVKLSDTPGPSAMRWKPVHRLVWEQSHGEVPAGHVIAFKPGRKSLKVEEITLDALECITRAESALRNKNGLGGMPSELAEVARLRGQLTRQIKKRAKQQKGETQP